MTKVRNTLSKREIISSKTIIKELFSKGSSFYLFPFSIKYIVRSIDETSINASCPEILITVPKRKFKRAVDRNLIKRRIREAYRLNKGLFVAEKPIHRLQIIFIYTADKILEYKTIERKLISGIHRLLDRTSGSHKKDEGTA